MSPLRIALLIAAKDLRQRFRDRSALVFTIVAPLGLAVIFSLLIGPSAAFHATWVVTDLDGGELATALRQDVIGGVAKAGVADVSDVATEDAARAAVAGGEADTAFIIPQGFTAAIESGRPITLEIVGSRTSGLATDVARAVAARFGDDVVGVQLALSTVGRLSGAPPSAADQARLAEAARTAAPPVTVVEVTTDLKALDLATFFSASMAILFLFFSAQAGLLSVYAERRQGTLRRILAAPVGPGTILVGKLLGAFAMSLVAMTTLVIATTLLIHADWGPPAGVVALLLAAVIAALGISALVISFATSEGVAANATAAVGITLAILGGTFAPSAQAPEAFATLSLFTPHGWFLRGLGELHGAGGGIAGAIPARGRAAADGPRDRRDRRVPRSTAGGPVTGVRKALEIGRINLLRQFRDRSDLFFVIILPTLIIVALGLQFGGTTNARLGVVYAADDPDAAALVAAIAADDVRFDVRTVSDEATLRSKVEHGELEAGLVIPAGFGATLRGTGTAEIRYFGTTGALAQGLQAPIDAAAAKTSAIVGAARIAAGEGVGSFDEARAAAESGYSATPGVAITVSEVGEPGQFAGFNQFTFGASTQLVMFTFLTSMTASLRLVLTRQLGVSRRMSSTPTSPATIVAGEALGRYGVAVFQATYIVVVSALLFGVSWGNPLAAAAIILVFALVSAGAAMLLGSTARNPDQASSLGVFIGLALGALGGCMVPLQIMPPSMQSLARLIPHSWAVTGLQSLITDGGGIDSVATNLLVLLGFAVVLLALASWRFRKAITG